MSTYALTLSYNNLMDLRENVDCKWSKLFFLAI